MKQISLFLISILLLASCSSSDNIFLGKFRQAPAVEVTDVACERLGLEVPGGAVCYLSDTLLIVYTPIASEWFFSLYSLNDLSPAGQVIRVGNGPGEYPHFSSFIQCGPLTTKNGEARIWVTDPSDKQLKLINISRSLVENRTIADSIVDVSNIEEQTCYWQPAGDHLWANYYIGDGGFGLLLYDSSADTVVCRQPLYRENHPDIGYFSTVKCINTGKTMWAGGMLDFPQMNFVPLSDGKFDMKKAFSVSFEKRPVPLSEVAAIPSINLPSNCYRSIIAIADRFVASYHATAESTELHIFDDRGNLLHRLRLDCQVPYFDIDPSTGMLYGLCSEQLIRADIARWLNTK